MTNIVQLHRARRSASDLAPQLKRAEALRSAVARKGRFSPDDQLRAAGNLHRLIMSWREFECFDLGRVLKAARLGGNSPTDSTKRLDTYTLPDNASPARRGRIAKKPSKYLELARFVAAELDKPEALILCQIFEGCSFGTDYGVDEDWEEGNWTKLAELMKQMASAVIRDHALEEYWRKVRATNGQYDVRRGIIRPAAGCLDFAMEGCGYAGDRICSDEIAPLPSIALGRRRQAPPIPGVIFFPDGQRLDVDCIFWLEVRIALGPVNTTTSIGPLIELRTVLEATTNDGRAVTFDNPFTDTTDVIEAADIGGNVRRIKSVVLFDYDLVPAVEYQKGAEHSYFAWEEVSPALLRRLLQPDDPTGTGRFHAVNRNHGVWREELPPSRFNKGSAAAILHTDLLTGHIERDLGQACADLADQLEAFRLTQETRIREAEAEAVTRWTTPGSTKSFISGEGSDRVERDPGQAGADHFDQFFEALLLAADRSRDPNGAPSENVDARRGRADL